MSDVILRQIEMLRYLPHYPSKLDSASLKQRLATLGYEVSVRTIQRDLIKLSACFPIINDDNPEHYGWSWGKGAEPILLSSMSPHVAITLDIVEQFTKALLPVESIDYLKGYFKVANGTLGVLSDQAFTQWRDKIRVVPRSHAVQPPQLSEAVSREVYQALFSARQLVIRYVTASSDEEKSATVNPLGLIIREPVIYLLCTFWDYQDVRQIPLHRIRNADVSKEAASAQTHFDIDDYIQEGNQDIEVERLIDFKARVSAQQARFLKETPIAIGQVLEPLEDDTVIVSATLKETVQFRRWILSLTGSLEVLEPQRLREDIAGFVARQHAVYYTGQ